MKLVNVNVDWMQVFVAINNDGIMIYADVIKDLLEVLVIVNVINHVMLENIQIIKIANAETNQLKNVKMLMEMKWLRM